MNKFFRSRMIRSMIPYFILALAIIIAFRVSTELRFFTDAYYRFIAAISPFLTGAVIAYILNLPCTGIQKLLAKTRNEVVIKRSRGISVLILCVIVVIVIAIILNIVIPAVVSSVLMFIDELPNYQDTLLGWIYAISQIDLPDFIPNFYIDEEGVIAVINDWATSLAAGGGSDILDGIIAGFGGVLSAFFHAFLSTVSTIYFLVEKDKLRVYVVRLVAAVTSEYTNAIILKYSRKLNFNFHQYIYTQTIDGMILGSIMVVVLLLFGSPYALVLGLILGILNYIPYFGSIIGTAFAVLVVAFSQGVFPTAFFAAIVMFAIQQLDGNFIQPKLMGGSFSLSPLLVIISVTIGMNYGGVLGMLVAIPFVAILKDILDAYIKHLEQKKTELPQPGESSMDRDIW